MRDRLNLLYQIAHVFADLEINVALARITTEKGVAFDTFYVAKKDGSKLSPDIDFPQLRDVISYRLRS
jgi:UTP:GlnB (protein PII) uridylyltransferase